MIAQGTTLLLLALASGATAQGRAAPGFDCARAATRTEKAICADPALSNMDAGIAEMFGRLIRHTTRRDQPAVREGQRAWLAMRDACADAACLRGRYDARATDLRRALDRRDRALRAGLARVGQCQVTTIDLIGPRLGLADPRARYQRPDTTGSSVGFANGVHQVSYEFESGVAQSRIGDRARVCLASIPKHCPPGDDRGRFYAVINLRTGARWKMPDAQHLCGGA